MNIWKIPKEIEDAVKERDKFCVYCGREFTGSLQPTWEHIINDVEKDNIENIALCCRSCNSSKSNRKLSEWLVLESPYRKANVNYSTISEVVKNILKNE